MCESMKLWEFIYDTQQIETREDCLHTSFPEPFENLEEHYNLYGLTTAGCWESPV